MSTVRTALVPWSLTAISPAALADTASVAHGLSRCAAPDTLLEQADARIGTITIDHEDIFDASDPREDGLY